MVAVIRDGGGRLEATLDNTSKAFGKPMDTPHVKYQRLVQYTEAIDSVVTAVAHPCDERSLEGVVAAAVMKEIDSPVAGRATVPIVPDPEAGNMLANGLSSIAVARVRRETPAKALA